MKTSVYTILTLLTLALASCINPTTESKTEEYSDFEKSIIHRLDSLVQVEFNGAAELIRDAFGKPERHFNKIEFSNDTIAVVDFWIRYTFNSKESDLFHFQYARDAEKNYDVFIDLRKKKSLITLSKNWHDNVKRDTPLQQCDKLEPWTHYLRLCIESAFWNKDED